jgi:hypothetical protein
MPIYRNTTVLFVLVLALFLAPSCKNDDDIEIIDPITIDTTEVIIVDTDGDENYLTGSSDYVFDQNELRTYELFLTEEALSFLNDDPAAEQYVEGMLVFEGDTISPVGIRYKGSVGAFFGCVSGGQWFDPSGYKTCTKLSMKIKINWEGREERFFGLNKLQFHSMNNDRSQMHDRLAYWLFQEMDIPSPRSVHARLMINGAYNGLFALTEQIDGRFVKQNFDDDDGNLYKEIWPLSFWGSPFSEQEYKDALKTNEDENPDVSLIRGFGQDLASSSLVEGRQIVEEYMDLDEIISYAVVDRTIRHDDGPFHWYCFNGCASHNFYWYEEPNEQKLHLIPWDMDNAFENIIQNNNPVTSIADDWGEVSNNCFPFQYSNLFQWSAACDKLTAVWASYASEYQTKKNELINGPMSKASTDAMLDLWAEQIRSATEEASLIHDDAVSISEWEYYLNELKDQLEFARNN